MKGTQENIILTQENILVLVLDFSSYETTTYLLISLSLP